MPTGTTTPRRRASAQKTLKTALRRGEANALAERLEALPVGDSLFVDVAFAPWVIRARELLGVALPPQLDRWLERLGKRPAIAAELELVGRLA